MKKLFFIWLTFFSVSAFAQTKPNATNEILDFQQLEKEGYVQVAPDLGHNSEYQCWIGLIFKCDENGNITLGDPITVTAYSPQGIQDKQREYCETGSVTVPRECEP